MDDNRHIPKDDGSAADPVEYGTSRLLPQGISSQVTSSGLLIGRTEHISRVKDPLSVQNPMTPSMNLPASDIQTRADAFPNRESVLGFHYGMNAFLNELSSGGREEDIPTRNELRSGGILGNVHQGLHHLMDQVQALSVDESTSSEEAHLRLGHSSSSRGINENGLLTFARNGDISKIVLPGIKYEDTMGNEFPPSRPDQVFNLSEYPLDERVVDIASQLLSVSNENTDFTGPNISSEYLKLYHERSPENYDFAMNIMAYIEVLNDSSWTATVSYFDENVKRMITSIWEEKRVSFHKRLYFQCPNRESTQKLMLDFTQWSINEGFDLGGFLNYCVLMCQLGVYARKHIFKEASLYAIGKLRDRMKFLKFGNLVPYLFDIVVKDYAKRKYNL